MEFRDYYKLLGVAEDADEKAIKTAYRRLARKYHPDVSKEDNAEEQFKAVAEAYEVLKDAEKRAEYDQLRKYGGRHGEQFRPPPGWQPATPGSAHFTNFDGDFSDFFETLFGTGARGSQQRATPQRGRDVEMELPIFLEDTLSDESKTIRYHVPRYDPQGRRLEDESKSLNVKIPKGVADGERIRLKAQGAQAVAGGTPGDLYLHIRLVPHPLFDVEGHNLLITVPLAPWEAALGTKIEIPTLTGRIQMTIPAGSQTGKRLRIRGKGLPSKLGTGDLYAVLKVVMPPQQDEGSNALWAKLAEKTEFDPRSEWSQKA